MDIYSFGMRWKSNEILVLHWIIIIFYSSVWIGNALSIVCSERLKLSRNNQNIKMFGVPPNTLPLVIYIWIFCYWVLLHYDMSFKTFAGWFNGAFCMVWSTFWRLRNFKTNLPKLFCGFKDTVCPRKIYNRTFRINNFQSIEWIEV